METADSSNALDVSARTEDLKYMQALTVNVSNFVSVKLSGHSNYKIWKAQMLCLIESQLLLHIVDAENQFPVDKGVHMIRQYDKLVKGWIFGSVNEKVLKDLVDLGTAQEVWMKLGSLFNLPTSNTEADSSNALGVSAPDAIAPVVYAMREDLKYNQALNVDVSNFVSEKLEGKRNYYTWKNEMLSLIRSHELLHIIRDKARFPWDEGDPMTQKYDSLVRGWILNNMNNFLRDKYRMYRSVQEMWMRLESTYNYLPKTRDSSKGDTKDNSSSEIEDMEYMQLKSNVNVSNFVSVKLCGRSNYNIWKDQILHLLQSHSLLHILDEEARSQQYKNDPMTKKYESLVRGWILGAMNNEERHKYRIYQSVKLMWSRVNSTFGETKDSKYTEASNVKLSYIVRVNLSNNSNYSVWKAHMLYLLEWQSLLHIINDEYCSKEDKYHELVKGWLLCTMNDELLKDFPADNHVKHTAKHLWKILESHFSKDEPATSPVFEFRRAEFVRVPEIEDTDSSKIKKELYEAAVEGCWWKAKSILKIHKNAATEAITTIGDTILHLAVETGHNYFLEKLLDFIEDGEDIEKKNDKGRTALHIAAVVGNTHAAQLLVKKRSQLLQILDCDEKSPLDICYTNVKVNTCAYLLKSRITYGLETYSIFEEPAIMSAIITKDYDSAQSLLEKFPECASQDKYMLFSLTITFPSDLGFIETFIYPSFNNVHEKTIARCSLLFHPLIFDICVDDILRIVKICNNTCCSWLGTSSMILFVPIVTLYPIYQLICFLILLLRLPFSILYLLMWKVFAVTLPPIKNIEKKKKAYREAKKILSLVCSQMGTSNSGYKDALFEAVRQDTYEVVDEILLTSPATIDCKDKEGYNIIQSAIMNRAEKVYGLLYHIIERTKSYRETEDSSENNLVHLAGKLAPSFVLERTTGAALQLQRELLWHEEVKKIFTKTKLRDVNNNKETPAMVFTREHRDLMKEGENWIKKTAESCSITAALIVTVVFAAAITVPGGSNQESGIPVFKKEAAFTVFAVSNAFSLFTASTALLLYLSILTARFSENDFLVSLPRRLIFGLLMLFLSTISMMVAFGAILFLVFCDQRPWMLAPICVFTCFPISVIVTVKLPLLVDLIRSIYFPIFGNRSYLESCSINRKNTIFTE